jgi:peptidoglycan/xylan/chitin deacetylase (PgdA/CDA1 family)
MKSSNHTSVFYDPKGKRWNIFLTCFSAIGFCVIFILSFLGVQIINVEKLPPITLPQSVKGEVFTSDGKTLTKFASVDRKKVALTFDDGPDKRNTPEILDILKEYEVPATFFIIGSNANSEIDLLHRIYDEGHELGNHTYTHLNMENASLWRQKIEINATQKILQSQLGISSAIFRAPYSDDHDPHTQKQLLPVKVASELGYLSVGMKIDPHDWQVRSKDELVQKVLTKVREGHGNIILLHDGGDDRTKTIAALPIIIDQLKKEGYTFVSVSQLIGLDSAHIPLSNSPLTQINNQLASLGFGLLRFTNQGIFILALISIVFGVLRFILIIAFAIVGKRLVKAKRFDHNFTPKVAAIVPAYNEEKVITKTIDSLVESDYPNLEVIVVDDGSSDNTFEIVKRHTKNIKNIKDFRKENGGKSSAINFGLSQTIADIVVIIDADTILKHDAISKLVRHFKDPAVGAVAGNAKVGNRVNLLTKLQAIEYITSQNLERRAFSVFNCIRVVAGAIGAWRKDLIIQAGLFTNDTLAEDTDMTLRILRLGYRVDYEADAMPSQKLPKP